MSRSTNTSAYVTARETQLLREVVAVMTLRGAWRKRSRADGERVASSRGEMAESPEEGNGSMESAIGAGADQNPANRRTRILLISDYEGLRFSRELLLRKHGYDVEAMSSGQFLAKRELCQCDLAILCQSLESDRALVIGAILRRTEPGTAQLRVHPFRRGLEPEFDLCVDGFDGPGVLLNILQAFVCAHPKVV